MAIFTACDDSQTIYRIMLMAMSHPGKRYAVAAPGNDSGGQWLILRLATCLMDHEVTFALSDGWDDALHKELAQRTGAHPTNWEQADFVFIAGGASDGWAATAKRGSLAYPDEGATLVYCVAALTEASAEEKTHQRARLTGPGIAQPGPPGLAGLSMAEYNLLQAVNADYPIGVDAFVVHGNQFIMGLPRSTRIEVK